VGQLFIKTRLLYFKLLSLDFLCVMNGRTSHQQEQSRSVNQQGTCVIWDHVRNKTKKEDTIRLEKEFSSFQKDLIYFYTFLIASSCLLGIHHSYSELYFLCRTLNLHIRHFELKPEKDRGELLGIWTEIASIRASTITLIF